MKRNSDNRPVIKIALLGAGGRMGQTIIEVARDFPGIWINAAVVTASSPLLGQLMNGIIYTSGLQAALVSSDVVVDFSIPASTSKAVDACVAANKPLVIGVTGLDAELRNRIETASRSIPMLAAPNMSFGAVLLQRLAHTAAVALSDDFAVAIKDEHHRQKKDAPSGTALALGEAVASARGVALKEHAVFESLGHSQVEQPGDIRFTSIRRDDIVGNHSVSFAGYAESLELTHHAHDRAAFARGALITARWIAGKPAGLYAMTDVLGI